MTGCIDRKTGKVTLLRDDGEDTAAIVKRLLSAAALVDRKDESGRRKESA